MGGGRKIPHRPRGRPLAPLVLAASLAIACGSSTAPSTLPSGPARTPQSSAASTGPDGSPSPGAPASPGPGASAAPAATTPLAVVTGFSNYKVTGVTLATLSSRLAAGSLLVPCGAEPAVTTALGHAVASCVRADGITARLRSGSTALALLPAALVTPAVRVVPLAGADLFGETPARSATYPLTIPTPAGWPAAWTGYDAADVRVVLSTGVNCPDRGVSYQTNVLGKGWDWLLQAGTARYTGISWFAPMGWWVVNAVRTGHAGAVWDLIRNADVAVSDFECPMTSHFTQHDTGTVFSIDPRVAALMKKAGFDVATIGADHTTNAGLGAVGETVAFFRRNGIQPVGGGTNLAQALKPAVVDAHGVTFGFVGFDAIGGSAYATASTPGVAPLTAASAKKAIAAARAQGAQVVIALPQWSSVEYRAAFTDFQRALISTLQAAGADHIIGADFHWAGAISLTRGGRSGYRFVSASQGNFWFGQDWSRQTEEGVMTMLTFVGTRLAQVRLIPTVVLDNAQPNLTDPATDGQYVLKQVLGPSTLLQP